ncbi:MAG: lytic transglycosylase domain-containing protein [Bacillota bacterium]
MELDSLVQLMQLQMLSQTYSNSGRRQSDGVGQSANFALILAALMDSEGTGQGLTTVPAARSKYNSGVLTPVKGENSSVAETGKKEGSSFPVKNAAKSIKAAGIEEMIQKTAEKFGLDPSLLRAVVKVESDFNPLAVSGAGAMGLMQLMPGTARSLGVENPYDPLENLEGGAKYLKSMLERFGGNVSLALAAYNAGPGAVKKYGGVPPYSETVSYLNKINSMYRFF